MVPIVCVIAKIVNTDLDESGLDCSPNYSKVKDRSKDLRKDRYDIEAHIHFELRVLLPRAPRTAIYNSKRPSGGLTLIRLPVTSMSTQISSANGISNSRPFSFWITRTSVPPVRSSPVTCPSP